MSVLITGGAGFIGSAVANLLVKKYENIKFIILDKLDYCSNLKNISEIINRKNCVFVKGNILNSELINHLLLIYDIKKIIHFAAQSHVDNSFGNSLEFTETNVLGTHTLLECAKNFNIEKFIHVSTDEVYGEVIDDKAGETYILNPNNPYSCSKAGAEFVCQGYIRSFKLPIIITRGNNVYGEKQFPEKVIPKFVNQLLQCKKITIHGDGSVLRTFIYVEDVAKAFEKILFEGKINEIYNIGSEYEISVKDLGIKIINIMKELSINTDYFNNEQKEFLTKNNDFYIKYVDDRLFNDKRYSIDSSKIKNMGIDINNDFDKQLKKTVLWYVINKDWWSEDILNKYIR